MSPSLDTIAVAPTRTPSEALLNPLNANEVGRQLQTMPKISRLTQKTIDPNLYPEEQKKLERLITDTIARISQALKVKFESAKLNINIAEFEKGIKWAISTVTLNPDIPVITKIKYMEDIAEKAKLLGDVTAKDISTLRTRRAVESLGVETIELQIKYGNDEDKKQSYFLQKILMQTIGAYAEPAAYWLVQAFSKEAQTIESTGTFNRETFESTQQKLRALDLKYGMNFGSTDSVQGFLSGEGGAREVFLKKIEGGLLAKHPNGVWLGSMIRNGVVSPKIRDGADVTVAGKTINVIDAYIEYRSIVQAGRKREEEVREARSVGLSQWIGADIKRKIWVDQIKSEFYYLKPENIESKVRSANVSDMVIMGTQLLQMAPIVGDIGGGLSGLVNALSGVNIEGAKMSALERSLNGIFGVLGIAVIGGLVNRAHKAGKLAGMIETLGQMRKYLPEKLETLIAATKNLSPEMIQGIKSLGKFLNIDRHIERILAKQGLWALHFAPVAKLGRDLEHGKTRVKPETISKVFDMATGVEGMWEDILWIDKMRKTNTPKTGETSKKASKTTSEELKSRQELAQKRSGIDPKIVAQNASVPDTPEGRMQRLNTASSALKKAGLLRDPDLIKEWLVANGKLTPLARDAILAGHHAGGDIYGDSKSVSDKARAARALPPEWRRVLMERGIMGSLPADNAAKETEQILSAMNIRWVDSVLQKAPNQTVTQPIMNALVTELESRWPSHLGSLNSLLEEYGLVKFSGDQGKMYETALQFSSQRRITQAMADIWSISSKKVLELTLSGWEIQHKELLLGFLKSGNTGQKELLMNTLLESSGVLTQIVRDPEVLTVLIQSSQKNPTLSARLLTQMVSQLSDVSIPSASIKALQTGVEDATKTGHLQWGLVNSNRERLAQAVIQRSPIGQVRSIIAGAKIDGWVALNLRSTSHPLHNAWNEEFESLRLSVWGGEKRANMILSGEFEFFNKHTLDTFLNMTFWDLNQDKQAVIVAKIQGEKGAFVRQNFPRFMQRLDAGLSVTR
jgi:hypothetical protein